MTVSIFATRQALLECLSVMGAVSGVTLTVHQDPAPVLLEFLDRDLPELEVVAEEEPGLDGEDRKRPPAAKCHLL